MGVLISMTQYPTEALANADGGAYLRKYIEQMGWSFGSGVKSMRFNGTQGKMSFVGVRDQERYSLSYFGPDMHPLFEYGFDGCAPWYKDQSGASRAADPELQKEFVTEMALMTNAFASMPATDLGPVKDVPAAERIRISPEQGAPADVWIDRNSGALLMSFILLDKRVAQFRPIATSDLSAQEHLIVSWRRDAEPLIHITSVQTNQPVAGDLKRCGH